MQGSELHHIVTEETVAQLTGGIVFDDAAAEAWRRPEDVGEGALMGGQPFLDGQIEDDVLVESTRLGAEVLLHLRSESSPASSAAA